MEEAISSLRNRQFIKQALERVEVARRAGAATNRERIKKEKDKKRGSFKEAVYIVCFQQSGPNQAP